jgi:hypothetical protein
VGITSPNKALFSEDNLSIRLVNVLVMTFEGIVPVHQRHSSSLCVLTAWPRCDSTFVDKNVVSVWQAVGRCSALKSLDMSGCMLLTDNGVLALAVGGFPSLAKLCFRGCSLLTDVGLELIVSGRFPNLESLDVSCCDLLTEMGLTALAAGGLSHFASLDVTNCKQLRTVNSGLQTFVQLMCPSEKGKAIWSGLTEDSSDSDDDFDDDGDDEDL